MVEACVKCGHELGIGRFCVNCGHPVGAPAPDPAPPGGSRTDPAERPRVPEETSYDPPPGPPPAGAPDDGGHRRHVDEGRRHGAAAAWVPWVAGLTALLLLAAFGLWLLLSGDEQPRTQPVSEPTRTEQGSRDPRTPQGRATVSPAPEGEPADLTGQVSVRAPAPAPPTQDLRGRPVRFVAGHLVDGVADTCWRMAGDGTGERITFRLDGPAAITELGLVNGYAKTAVTPAGAVDWYAGNRRTLRVAWGFDDGTAVEQELAETRDLQTVSLGDGVVTEKVTLRLLQVTPPGAGPASRDFTALSGVRLMGTPTA